MNTDNPQTSFLHSVEMAATNTSQDQHDPFWTTEAIDAARWNQVFPYQLFLVRSDGKGNFVQDRTTSNFQFTLPFAPESLSISMPFAITGSVTQGGYVEEHGGTPIRMIQLSGSLGVLPLRPSATTRPDANLGQAIFAGTIQQGQRVATSAIQLTSSVTGENFTKPNLVDATIFNNADADSTNIAKTSGYYQLRLLEKFFEDFAAFKKTKTGKPYRLAFAIWKRQAVYLVTPVSFNASQNANSPLEHIYQLSLRAYRRISFDSTRFSGGFDTFKPAAGNPNALQRMLKTISDARDVLENARDIVASVGGDLDTALFLPLRQTALFLKDALAVPLAFADLPIQIMNDCKDAVIQWIATGEALNGASQLFTDQSDAVVDAYQALAQLAATSAKAATGSGNLSDPGAYDSDIALDVFRHPEDNYDFWKGVQPGQVNLTPQAVRAIVNEREKIKTLKRLDFEQMRDSVIQVMADFADAVGAGNATFTATYQRATRNSTKTPTLSDFQVLFSLNRVAMELNGLAASGKIDQRLSSMDYVAGLARQSGIAFQVPKSKFAVPYPYGVTIEQLANQYLGDPDRWIEIAALNGLRAPYVDEVGFDLTLLTNGRQNQVTVADSTNLFVGQQVWLSSASTSRTTRHITNIDVISSTMSILTLDGDSDLDRFSTLAGAVLHAFLPDTVNSQQMLYIPSDIDPVFDDHQVKAIPGVDVYDQLLEVGGVDLLLTQSGDLAITPDGDCRLAVGLANIIQTARTRLSVVKGTLNRHPEYGLPVKVGQSIADMDAKALLKAARNLFADDPTFTGVTSASVLVNGPTTSIAMAVGIRGQSQVIPLTLNIQS